MKYLFLIFVFLFGNAGVYAKDEEITTESVLNVISYDWWYNFDDRNLERYILKGIINNNDLKISKLKIKEYEQFVKYTFGQELPTVSASFSGSYTDNMPTAFAGSDKSSMILPISMSYELDLFGKNRLNTKATKKELEMYGFQLQSSYISYVSSLATVYLNIVRYNELINLYDELIFINQKVFENRSIHNRNGLTSKNEVNTAEQAVKDVRIQRLNAVKDRDNLLTQFAVLLGEDPSETKNLKITDYKDLNFSGKITDTISSNVIFSRPDVLAAEKEMEKADIDIKVARREFLPTFNLSAYVLFNDITAGGFFSNPIASLVGGISQSIFAGGRKKANLRMKEYKYQQLLEQYKKVSLQAIKEVNDSLVNTFNNKKITDMNRKNLLLESENYSNNVIKNKNGLISDIDLLQSKQKLINNRINMVNSKIENYIDYISLYKSVGGKI